MKVNVKYKADTVEIIISGFLDEEAEDILGEVRRVFYEHIQEEEK